jgi:hypothetical protein
MRAANDNHTDSDYEGMLELVRVAMASDQGQRVGTMIVRATTHVLHGKPSSLDFRPAAELPKSKSGMLGRPGLTPRR